MPISIGSPRSPPTSARVPSTTVVLVTSTSRSMVRYGTPDDVRAVPDHQIGPGVDGRVRERLRIAPVLPEAELGPPGDRVGLRALGAHVRVDDDEIGLLRRRAHHLTDGTGPASGAGRRRARGRRTPDHPEQ